MNAANQFLNAFASIAVRVWPLEKAKRRVDRLGSLLKRLDPEQAQRAAFELRGGTCLSRALTVAARLPAAEVVIGCNRSGASFHAHAWVEANGNRVGPQEPVQELARLK